MDSPTPNDIPQQTQAAQAAQQQAEPKGVPTDNNADAKSQDDGNKENQPELSVEDMQKELAKARKDAARYRTERNSLREKTEKETAANRSDSDRIADLEQKLEQANIERARATVAKATGLPGELIFGSNSEEMEASAERVTELINERVTAQLEEKLKANPVMPVVPGEAAGAHPVDEEDWLRKAFLEK
ncbi:hypothetical protein [Corynebacterium sp.]|uniref:hypothetical protein n=1 Tax=Corynebacterium sp. TaxID=1720 RepID=UPI0028AA8080|nr:hypothetical protein [Corynebacterium sp.]